MKFGSPLLGLTAAFPGYLLGAFPGGVTTSGDLTVPGNASTIRILTNPAGDGTCPVPVVKGVSSGFDYPVSSVGLATSASLAVWGCVIDPALDSQITVTWLNTASDPWWVTATEATQLVGTVGAEVVPLGSALDYATQQIQAASLTATLSGDSDSDITVSVPITSEGAGGNVGPTGMLYTIPSAPNTAPGDHPYQELGVAVEDNQTVAVAAVIPAPGAGKRLRIFFAEMAVTAGSAGGVAALFTGAGNLRCAVGFALTRQLAVPLTGIAIAANTGVSTGVTGTVTYGCTVIYTVENI